MRKINNGFTRRQINNNYLVYKEAFEICTKQINNIICKQFNYDKS